MSLLDLFSKICKRGAIFFVAFFALCSLTLLFAPKAQAGPNSPAGFGDDGEECAWVADSKITCGTGEWWFNVEKTTSLNYAVFQKKDGSNWVSENYIVFEADAKNGELTKDPAQTSGGTDAFLIDREKRNERVINDSNNLAICGLRTVAGDQCYDGRDGPLITISNEQGQKIQAINEQINSTIDSEEDCTEDAGSLGFVLCPILRTTRNAVGALIGDGTGKGFLVELLTIRPLSTTNTPELYNGWQAIRNIALGMYILVFVLIIFGNGVGYDPYTIKRALPRLAAGVVLTFASWWIMQTLVDLSNLIGNVIPAFVAQLSGNAGIADYTIDLNPALALGSVVLLIVVAFVALGALLVGIAGLIMRVVIIYGLVLLAPIAFIAWVLPNTEGLFKKWWQNLIRVLMMFPIVTGMLSLSLFFQTILLNTQTNAAPNSNGVGGSAANSVTGIVGMLAPLIAIILIPKTFKWGGAAFAAAAGYMAAKATQGKDFAKGQGRDRVGKSMREGIGATALNKIGQKEITNPDGSKALVNRPGFSRIPGIGAVTSKRKAAVLMGQRQARVDKRYKEGLDGISDDNLANIYDNMSNRQKKGGYGVAVSRELGKRRSGMIEDYAKARRDGDVDGANRIRTRITKLDTRLDAGGVKPPDGSDSHAEDTTARLTSIDNNYTAGRSAAGGSTGTTGGATGTGGAGSGGSSGGTSGRGGTPLPPRPSGGPGTGPSGSGGGSAGGGGTPRPGGGPITPPPPPSGGTPTYTTPTGAPRYTTGGTPIPPPPSGGTPTYTAPPGGGSVPMPPPSGGTPTSGGGRPAAPPPPSGSTPTYTTPAGAPRYTTGGTPVPPPPSGNVPVWTSPGTAPSSSSGVTPPPPPSGGSSSGSASGGTVINNVTNNNSTTNSTTNNNNVKTVLNNNGVPSSIAMGAAAQLGDAKKRFGEGTEEHDSLASIESKLNDLGRMIQSGSLSQTRLRENIQEIHENIDVLPLARDQQDSLRGALEDIQRNATDDEA